MSHCGVTLGLGLDMADLGRCNALMRALGILADIPRPEKYTSVVWSVRMPSWLAAVCERSCEEFGTSRAGFIRGSLVAHASLVRRMCYKVLDNPKVEEEERERLRALIELITDGLAAHAAMGGNNPADARAALDGR